MSLFPLPIQHVASMSISLSFSTLHTLFTPLNRHVHTMTRPLDWCRRSVKGPFTRKMVPIDTTGEFHPEDCVQLRLLFYLITRRQCFTARRQLFIYDISCPLVLSLLPKSTSFASIPANPQNLVSSTFLQRHIEHDDSSSQLFSLSVTVPRISIESTQKFLDMEIDGDIQPSPVDWRVARPTLAMFSWGDRKSLGKQGCRQCPLMRAALSPCPGLARHWLSSC